VKVTSENQGYRKHRFDSCQVALARHVVRTEGVIKLALQIAEVRKGEQEALRSNYYLLYISGRDGMLRLLLLAMLADAGDEGIIVIRSVDTERANPSEIACDIATFVARIQYLFMEGHCVEHGYTNIMLGFLKRGIIYTVNGTALQCGSPGGVPDSVIKECLLHMKCWVRLAVAVCSAEFPEFTLLSSMSSLKLHTGVGDQVPRHESLSVVGHECLNFEKQVCRLAEFFEQPCDQLMSQLIDVKGLATTIKSMGGARTDKAAYKLAVERYERKHNLQRHPTDVVKVILIRWIGWVISSSGVEQNFTHFARLLSNAQRCKMSRQREQDIITLLADITPLEIEETISMAGEIWKMFYGNARNNPRSTRRIDLGIQRKRKKTAPEAPVGSAALVKKRRMEVTKAVAKANPKLITQSDLCQQTAEAWTDRMGKLESEMHLRRAERVMDQVHSNIPVDQKVLGGLHKEEVARIFAANLARLSSAREKKFARRKRVFAPRQPVEPFFTFPTNPRWWVLVFNCTCRPPLTSSPPHSPPQMLP
jgi:hypothetical protein